MKFGIHLPQAGPAASSASIRTIARQAEEPVHDVANAARNLIDEIRLIPRDGQLDIYLVGNLAEILNLCGKKNPGSKRDGVQVTLVAGARNHLYRTVVIWQRTAAYAQPPGP